MRTDKKILLSLLIATSGTMLWACKPKTTEPATENNTETAQKSAELENADEVYGPNRTGLWAMKTKIKGVDMGLSHECVRTLPADSTKKGAFFIENSPECQTPKIIKKTGDQRDLEGICTTQQVVGMPELTYQVHLSGVGTDHIQTNLTIHTFDPTSKKTVPMQLAYDIQRIGECAPNQAQGVYDQSLPLNVKNMDDAHAE